jgi:PIN domain nuclease of toxin-antitoxin system
MKLLLDTCTFLWLAADAPGMTPDASPTRYPVRCLW